MEKENYDYSDNKNKHFVIDCAIYPFDLFCFFGSKQLMFSTLGKYVDNEIITSDEYIKIKEMTESSDSSGCFIMSPDNFCLLYLPDLPDSFVNIGILSHEIFHTTSEILRKCGIILTKETEEVFAYFLQYLTTNIYQQLYIVPFEDLKSLKNLHKHA